ncbi:tRNA epoxyqueuosine(34) reductase QueG [Plebeiibacterium sediminum]|uniref:tRNA epoxyqueuosine(34) reductase QueG n=1 Tax=Plebeiibacterium sediminum TaxID=2992112 RepID=A0AAE3SGD1_9BACT|nr:tRNA epoxyqueuosine(34) reductase QueG [Plebeiobacterium sediminum]MCW3787173.1 tRNA epoxyqueuosine(34) reductase QueG [Plebeiobacterium sediminum]
MDLVQTGYTELIKEKAKSLGFDDCGITRATELDDDKVYLKKWLDNKMHGEMHYMENHFEKRIDASLLVEGAKSVIVLLKNYFPKDAQTKGAPVISRYAYGEDYHFVLKDKMQELFDFIKTEIYPSLEGRCFVDSAPILERAYAVNAGLGWIGKHSNLIHKRLGSYVFISELVVNLELDYGEKIKEACGGCTRCVDACPTGAIISPKVIDSNKCISYLTIENKGEIPEVYKGKMDNRMYGCDICQEACPWTWKSRPHKEERFMPNPEVLKMTKSEWSELTQERFSTLFKKSPVKRAKFSGLRRNIDFLE